MSTSASSRTERTLLVLVAVLIGIIVGMIAAWLVTDSGGSVAAALATAGVAFAGTVGLVIKLETTLGLFH